MGFRFGFLIWEKSWVSRVLVSPPHIKRYEYESRKTFEPKTNIGIMTRPDVGVLDGGVMGRAKSNGSNEFFPTLGDRN